MKKPLIIFLCIFFVSIVPLMFLDYLKKSEFEPRPHSMQANTLREVGGDQGYVIKNCSAFDVAFKKYEMLINDIDVSGKTQSEVDREWYVLLQNFIKDPMSKVLESSSIRNDDCGAQSSALLVGIYSQVDMKKSEIEAYDRLLRFSLTGNPVAIRALCLGDANKLPGKDGVPYCEMMLNEEESPVYKSSIPLVETILMGAYYKNKQADKLIDLCGKVGSMDKKDNCGRLLFSIATDFYDMGEYKKGLHVLDKAAIYDRSGVSQLELAEMYHKGEGGDGSLSMAVYWYGEALEKLTNGSLKTAAFNDMGVALEESMDYVAAFQYFQIAAEMGSSLGQLNLAKMYASGNGVLTDNKQAYAWSSIAVAKGLENEGQQEGAERFKNIQAFILSAQGGNGVALQQAQDLAQEYYKKYILHEKAESAEKKDFKAKLKTAIRELTS